MRVSVLKGTKQKLFNKKVFGFDIETCNDNKDFVMASIVGDNYRKFFYNKEDIIKEIRDNKIFRNSVIFATNLSFDFFGVFFKNNKFQTLFRGSDLLFAKSYFYKKDLYQYPKANYLELKDKKKGNTLKSVLFLDSMNYAKLSVAKMGEIVGLSKLKTPSFIGQMPRSKEQWDIMKEYNLRDSEVTLKFMKFMIDSFQKLGSTFKLTLASTSMSLFKNKYLDKDYFQLNDESLLDIFQSYYGGRTEAFSRGHIKDYYYYDFNSLYPAMMANNNFPDPNSHRISSRNDISYINKYEGCSLVEIYQFPTRYPLLPNRQGQRVLFTTGNIKGWYTHIELREAIKHGSVIKKVYKTHYFKRTCSPFKGFITDLYKLRKSYKSKNNPMEYVIKIVMNSLYGKFGQRFKDRDNWMHESCLTPTLMAKIKTVERKGSYIRITEDKRPSAFCIPIWASYITAYGRIALHREIIKHNPVYVDTDSIMIDHEIPDSQELGELKLEMKIQEGIIVRPKFYAFVDANNNEYVKIKGLGVRLNFLEFLGLLTNPYIEYNKFTKFKEALRRDLIPNQIIKTHKLFSLEDEKRLWQHEFNPEILEVSEPKNLTAENLGVVLR